MKDKVWSWTLLVCLLVLNLLPRVAAYDISEGCSSVSRIEQGICEQEESYLARITAFSRQHKLTALDHIIRYKKSLDVFESDLAGYCNTLPAQTEQSLCREGAAKAVARMEIVVLGTAMEFTEHQRTYYLTKQIEKITESMERLVRVFQDIENYIIIIGNKLDHIDPTPQ